MLHELLSKLARGQISLEDVLEHVRDWDLLYSSLDAFNDKDQRLLKHIFNHYKEGRELKTCSICFDEVLGTRHVTLPCGNHTMHRDCFGQWLRHADVQKRCPECRTPFTKQALEQINSNDSVGITGNTDSMTVESNDISESHIHITTMDRNYMTSDDLHYCNSMYEDFSFGSNC